MSDRDPEPPPEDPTVPPGELVLAEEGGVRVFYISAPTMADLVDRLALVLGEHMHDDDELHVTYNAMQNGWTKHPPTKGHLIRPPLLAPTAQVRKRAARLPDGTITVMIPDTLWATDATEGWSAEVARRSSRSSTTPPKRSGPTRRCG
jgi:hypothetical protein